MHIWIDKGGWHNTSGCGNGHLLTIHNDGTNKLHDHRHCHHSHSIWYIYKITSINNFIFSCVCIYIVYMYIVSGSMPSNHKLRLKPPMGLQYNEPAQTRTNIINFPFTRSFRLGYVFTIHGEKQIPYKNSGVSTPHILNGVPFLYIFSSGVGRFLFWMRLFCVIQNKKRPNNHKFRILIRLNFYSFTNLNSDETEIRRNLFWQTARLRQTKMCQNGTPT